MTDIPEDVMETAREAVFDVTQRFDTPGKVDVIARAILAERERCARVADDYTADGYDDDPMHGCFGEGYRESALSIAAAIRAGVKEGEG
jgi:hypothetical protein